MAKEWEFPNPLPGDELTPIPAYVETWEGQAEARTNEKYPLQCIGHHFKGRTHSTYGNLESLRDIHHQRVWINDADARKRGIGYETHDPVTVTHELKTLALQRALAEGKWQALITGIRRDEDPTRAKERYFSPRNKDNEWNYKDQPPEFWNQFATHVGPGENVRVQPILDWTELDIWLYIRREGIPIPSLYFAREGKRYRSLGCWPITHPIESNASTIDEIIEELRHTKTSERAGRAQDHAERNAMQKLRAKGFF